MPHILTLEKLTSVLDNGLVQSGNKPLSETMSIQIYVAIASLGHKELTTDMGCLSNEILKHYTKYLYKQYKLCNH